MFRHFPKCLLALVLLFLANSPAIGIPDYKEWDKISEGNPSPSAKSYAYGIHYANFLIKAGIKIESPAGDIATEFYITEGEMPKEVQDASFEKLSENGTWFINRLIKNGYKFYMPDGTKITRFSK